MATTYGVGSNVPHGWRYDALNNHYIGPNGDTITMREINHHGTLADVLKHRQYEEAKRQMMLNTPTVPGSLSQAVNSIGSLSIATQPAATLSFDTDHGRVILNIKTGDLTIPGGMGREDAIREFWLGFQKHFNCGDVSKYEKRIKELQQDVARAQATAALMKKDDEKEAAKKIAEKVAKKYAGEKFIMVKPEDLIKFIQEA